MLLGINLDDWKTSTQILKEVKESKGIDICARTLRKAVQVHNHQFNNHKKDTYIVHSTKGYKETNDFDEIMESLNDIQKRAMALLNEKGMTLKALCEMHQERIV